MNKSHKKIMHCQTVITQSKCEDNLHDKWEKKEVNLQKKQGTEQVTRYYVQITLDYRKQQEH